MTTPEKYIPSSRKWEDKAWLYEQYWGELQSVREMAARLDISRSQLRRAMAENNIPTRLSKYNHWNSVSPFAGFYGPGENAPTDAESRTVYEQDYDEDPTLMG